MESNSKQVSYFKSDFNFEEYKEQMEAEIAEILACQNQLQEEEKQPGDLKEKCQASWDKFYTHNQDKFFKNRNYLSFAFDIIEQCIAEYSPISLLEVGSGTGNTVYPLKEKYQDQIQIFACDFSPTAIKLLQQSKICKLAFVKDLAKDPITEIPENSLDFITAIFFLSAISPEDHISVLSKLSALLKPGGRILFRDYGAYDLAMLRFLKKGNGRVVDLGQRLFKRGDYTLACFFTLEQLEEAGKAAGMTMERKEYCTVENKNVKRGLTMRRVFVNAILRKLV